MASGDTLAVFTPLHNEPPTSNYATLDTRNSHTVLDFDASTDEAAVFKGYMPANYAGGGVTVDIYFAATGITTGDVIWNAAFERCVENGHDLDSDDFASAQASAATAVNGTDGKLSKASITFTDGAQMDSVAAGEPFRLKITRDADNGSDTAAADAELFEVVVKET